MGDMKETDVYRVGIPDIHRKITRVAVTRDLRAWKGFKGAG